MNSIKIGRLLELLEGMDPNKEIRLQVILEDHPHKTHIKTGLTEKILIEDDCIWFYTHPEHASGLYSASGFATITDTEIE